MSTSEVKVPFLPSVLAETRIFEIAGKIPGGVGVDFGPYIVESALTQHRLVKEVILTFWCHLVRLYGEVTGACWRPQSGKQEAGGGALKTGE